MFQGLFRQDTEETIENCMIAEYIWIDGTGEGLRSKSRTLNIQKINKLNDIPTWSFDGSSTGQATVQNSEVILKPVFYCRDPFKGPNDVLVLCSTWNWQFKSTKHNNISINPVDTIIDNLEGYILVPANTNFRQHTLDLWDHLKDQKLQFGIEQEYLVLEHKYTWEDGEIVADTHNCECCANKPYINSFSYQKLNISKIPHYCNTNKSMNKGRQVSETHYNMCLLADLSICGTNAEVLYNQWEYQIGICDDIDVADQLWMSRFILYRVAEQLEVEITLHPKPFKNLNGQGNHLNFSTLESRNNAIKAKMNQANNCCEIIKQVVNGLDTTHYDYIKFMGADNRQRLIGRHETSSFDTFSFSLADRQCSLRIPTIPGFDKNQLLTRKFAGYFEDRRPASNADPYVVCALVAQSIIDPLNKEIVNTLISKYTNHLKNANQLQSP